MCECALTMSLDPALIFVCYMLSEPICTEIIMPSLPSNLRCITGVKHSRNEIAITREGRGGKGAISTS